MKNKKLKTQFLNFLLHALKVNLKYDKACYKKNIN